MLQDEVWLSLVERYVRDVEAAGSNPVTSIITEGVDTFKPRIYAFFVASVFPLMAAKFLKKQRFSVKCQQKFTMFTKETKDSKYHLDPYRSVNFKTNENGNMICPAGKRFFYLKSSHVKGNKHSRTQEYYQCENCEGCELKGNCHRSKGNRITYMFRSKNYY